MFTVGNKQPIIWFKPQLIHIPLQTFERFQEFAQQEIVVFGSDNIVKLDPVGSTVRYEMMKLCTGSV